VVMATPEPAPCRRHPVRPSLLNGQPELPGSVDASPPRLRLTRRFSGRRRAAREQLTRLGRRLWRLGHGGDLGGYLLSRGVERDVVRGGVQQLRVVPEEP
jgi:hypothetical protein